MPPIDCPFVALEKVIDELKTKGSDCPFMKDLREHIIKYKIK